MLQCMLHVAVETAFFIGTWFLNARTGPNGKGVGLLNFELCTSIFLLWLKLIECYLIFNRDLSMFNVELSFAVMSVY